MKLLEQITLSVGTTFYQAKLYGSSLIQSFIIKQICKELCACDLIMHKGFIYDKDKKIGYTYYWLSDNLGTVYDSSNIIFNNIDQVNINNRCISDTLPPDIINIDSNEFTIFNQEMYKLASDNAEQFWERLLESDSDAYQMFGSIYSYTLKEYMLLKDGVKLSIRDPIDIPEIEQDIMHFDEYDFDNL